MDHSVRKNRPFGFQRFGGALLLAGLAFPASASAVGPRAQLALPGEAAGDQFGCSVANAGDMNGDGFADVIVGAYVNDAGGPSAGRAYVYGGASVDGTPDLVLTGEAAGDGFGYSVASAGAAAVGGRTCTTADPEPTAPPTWC